MASHDNNVKEYIYDKAGWTSRVFDSVAGGGGWSLTLALSQRYHKPMQLRWCTTGSTMDTKRIGLLERAGVGRGGVWVYMCPAECGKQEAHQHYISCYAPQMTATLGVEMPYKNVI